MLQIPQPDDPETVTIAVDADRSVDKYLSAVRAGEFSLKLDRTRLGTYLTGSPGISHEDADAWLADLAAGRRAACPR